MNVQQSYREGSVLGASPVELVVRLYEKMIDDLRQVWEALEKKDIKRRTDRIKHAILIVAHLQSSLDFTRGGKVAQDLELFYRNLRHRLLYVQFHPSKRAAAQLITDLMAVREAWVAVDRAERQSAAPHTGMTAAGADPAADHVPTHWNG